MIYRIVQYIQPWEIDDFDRQMNHLILSSYLIKDHQVIIDCTLNISEQLVNWKNSKILKDFFVSKFKYIETKLQNYFTVEFNTDEQIQGCVDKRRDVTFKKHDFVIWLDSDLFFPKEILSIMIEVSSKIEDKNFILSPEIIKCWDNSWDCIVNEKYIKEKNDFRDNFDYFSLSAISSNEFKISTQTPKFGGGWFNLFSASILKLIELPAEMGSYGFEDLYISCCAEYLSIKQYVIRNLIVSEIGNNLSKNKDYFKPFLSINAKNKEKISPEEFNSLINLFCKNN